MTGFNTMKRSTLVSLIAVSLCFVLMLGATWAWFSSTVTNQGNTIAVGTFKLDVTVNDVSIENTKDGTTAVAPVFTADNWAPGSTVEKTFTVKNAGSIAMNWAAGISTGANTADADLAAKINVTVKQGENTKNYTLAQLLAGQTLAEGSLDAEGTTTFTVTIAMAEDATSDLEEKELGFDIAVIANQIQLQ